MEHPGDTVSLGHTDVLSWGGCLKKTDVYKRIDGHRFSTDRIMVSYS